MITGDTSRSSIRGRTRRLGARRGSRVTALLLAALVGLQLAGTWVISSAKPAAAASGPGTVNLSVVSARTVTGSVTKGDAVPAYKWLIAVEDTGNPIYANDVRQCTRALSNGSPSPDFSVGDGAGQPSKPTDGPICQWPSIRYTPGSVPIVALGDQSTLNTTTGVQLPAGKYLISVTADGFKIDGAHFVVASGVTQSVTVSSQPYPLPLGILRANVFKDTNPVDGTYEVGVEDPLGGFTAHISDQMGEVTTDFYGNRLCTNYVHETRLPRSDPSYTEPGDVPLAGYSTSNYNPYSPVVFDVDGAPVIDATDPGGVCRSDVNGEIAVPNIGPDRYTLQVVSPTGQQWFQTTTLEGNHDWDMWIAEGDTGYDNELTVGGERVPQVSMGYVPYGYSGYTTVDGAALGADKGFEGVPAAGATPSSAPLARLSSPRATGRTSRKVTLTYASAPAALPAVGSVVTISGLPRAQRAFNGQRVVVASTSTGFSFFAAGTTFTNVAIAGAQVTLADAGPRLLTSSATGEISGTIYEMNSYIGGSGGLVQPGEVPLTGTNERGTVDRPILALSDLGNNDQLVYVVRGGKDGSFDIKHVPNGSYQLTVWDYEQNMIINSFNVTIQNGEHKVYARDEIGLVDWWTEIRGYVFIDSNGDGIKQTGEAGVPHFVITYKERDNSLMDGGINTTSTDNNGYYVLREAYPITRWMVEEAFNTRFATTSVTVQADNQPTPTVYYGPGVDLNVMPIIGLSSRVDWAVRPFTGSENGGIAGTVTYDTTRNELDPADAATEPYQPGIPGITTHLYYPVRDANGALVTNTDGSVKVVTGPDGKALDLTTPYVSETWKKPTGCTARKFDGSELTGTEQYALPPAGDSTIQCLESPMLGSQGLPSSYDVQGGQNVNFSTEVNGNYAYSAMDYDPAWLADAAAFQGGDPSVPDPGAPVSAPGTALPADDFVVTVDLPSVQVTDAAGATTAVKVYQVTREEDVNVFDGDARLPQGNFQANAGYGPGDAAVPVATGASPDASGAAGIVSGCVGALHTVAVTSQAFLGAGGSPYEGQNRPLCDAKLVSVRGNQTVAPNFNLFTEVPLPTHFWGLTLNDLGLSHDRTQLQYGEAEPLPNVPMGIYDWSGKLVDTVNTDYNGFYEALEPSTSSYNCPLPAGPCPGMYYFKGNDPGQPGHANKYYNPAYRTIGTNFQAWPGLFTVTDTAPTQVATIALMPGSTTAQRAQCDVPAATPQIFNIDSPYVKSSSTTPAVPGIRTNFTALHLAAVTDSTTARDVTLTFPAGVLNSGPGTAVAAGNVVAVALASASRTAPPVASTADPLALTSQQVAQLTGNVRVTAVTATSVTYRATNSSTVTLPIQAASSSFRTFGGAHSLTPATIAAVTTPVTSSMTINGTDFGTAPVVTLTNGAGVVTPQAGAAVNATGTQITVPLRVGATVGGITPGVYQVGLSNAGKKTVAGVSLHALGTLNGTTYTPTLLQVNPPSANAADSATIGGRKANFADDPAHGIYAETTYDSAGVLTNAENVLQKALDAAPRTGTSLVVVWPKAPVTNNPTGDYFEDLVVAKRIKLQGVGSGGFQTSPTGDVFVPGSRLNGLGFNPDSPTGQQWLDAVTAAGFDPTTVPDGAVVTELGGSAYGTGLTASTSPATKALTRASIDGFTITGGAVQAFPTNINTVTGGTTTTAGGPGALISQGGGVYLHDRADYTQIANNVITGNGGAYAGAIRIGTPYTARQSSVVEPNNKRVFYASFTGGSAVTNAEPVITHNRILNNGGANLAGGIGVFDGSPRYQISFNDLCGNFSAEYGGGITHYGSSDGGSITDNKIWLNQSYDEAGGIMIAGELPIGSQTTSSGAADGRAAQASAARLTIARNQIVSNLANDDGGGLRFLSAGKAPITVANNIIANNISTHEGGGIALDDAANVTIVGNTIVRNITTATAITSDGKPAPAGLSTANNSLQLQAELPVGSAVYSKPVLKDNLFFENWAGTFSTALGSGGVYVTGIKAVGDPSAPVVWDLGSLDVATLSANKLNSVSSIFSTNAPTGYTGELAGSSVGGTVPASFVHDYVSLVSVLNNRATLNARQSLMVVQNVAIDTLLNYHLAAGAPAINAGAIDALIPDDVDRGTRPSSGIDIGADEFGVAAP